LFRQVLVVVHSLVVVLLVAVVVVMVRAYCVESKQLGIPRDQATGWYRVPLNSWGEGPFHWKAVGGFAERVHDHHPTLVMMRTRMMMLMLMAVKDPKSKSWKDQRHWISSVSQGRK
jgi:hypothetical protein